MVGKRRERKEVKIVRINTVVVVGMWECGNAYTEELLVGF